MNATTYTNKTKQRNVKSNANGNGIDESAIELRLRRQGFLFKLFYCRQTMSLDLLIWTMNPNARVE